MGKAACTRAAQYPRELCDEVLKAIAVIKKDREETQVLGIDRDDMCEHHTDDEDWIHDEDVKDFFYEGMRDSATGEDLDSSQVRAGCVEELDFMRKMKVWDRIPRAEVWDKVIGTRWVYTKKPNLVRCRLVAQEFAGSDKREDLYAGTPPMAATRYLLSDSVSRGSVAQIRRRKLMVLDIKRAFLHGIATRTLYVELPDEESEGGKYVGRLNKTLYGTRDAPVAWLRAVRGDMETLGFLECKVTTGVFVHPVRDLRVVTHVDDFLVAGELEELLWLRDEMSNKYELKVQLAGW